MAINLVSRKIIDYGNSPAIYHRGSCAFGYSRAGYGLLHCLRDFAWCAGCFGCCGGGWGWRADFIFVHRADYFLAGSYDPRFFNLLQVLGSLYLLYLGVSILIVKTDSEKEESKTFAKLNIFLRGVVTNIANPKALVFFISFIPQFIPPHAQTPHLFALFLGVVLCAIGTSVNYIFGLGGVSLQSFSSKKIYGRAIFEYITALLFIIIAVIFLNNYWRNW